MGILEACIRYDLIGNVAAKLVCNCILDYVFLAVAMAFAFLFVVFVLFCRSVSATFGVTEAAEAFQVDTGGGLTFEVNK